MGCCCSVPRGLVSKKKLRIKESTPHGAVNLDLSVVQRQIVCMGLPAEGLEAWYRNPYDDVVDYLDFRFKDQYMVYNLCSEKAHVYPADRFHGRVAYFPFPDHHACPLEMIHSFTRHALGYLAGGDERVAVIHCKAGKGRTGLMACCLLMHLEPRLANARDAIEYYGKARTSDGRGLTIPSQIRYVEYYEQLIRSTGGAVPTHIPAMDVQSFSLRGLGTTDAARFGAVEFITSGATISISLDPTDTAVNPSNGVTVVHLQPDLVVVTVAACDAFRRLSGDVRVNFKSSVAASKWVGALTFHTLFMKKSYGFCEIDKLYKKTSLPQDAAITFDYLEVMTAT